MSKKQPNVNAESIAEAVRKFKEEEDQLKVDFKPSDLKAFKSMTKNQEKLKGFYKANKSLICDGVAGVGKTFAILNLAFEDVLNPNTPYEKIIIVRSAVSTRDIGFLPGTEDQKMEVFERPYMGICDEIFTKQEKNNYMALKNNDYVEFLSTSHIRGITVKNAILVVDECQNLNYHELKSVITRIGEDAKIFYCGDYGQSDLLKSKNDQSGILKFKNVTNRMESFEHVTFTKDDIVRSGIVSEFYKAEIQYEEETLS